MLRFQMPAKKRPGRPKTGETKQRILVTVDRKVVTLARAAGINISAAAESGIKAAVDRPA